MKTGWNKKNQGEETGHVRQKSHRVYGSPRKLETYKVVQEFEKDLKRLGDVDFEYVFLNDYNLGICKGCLLCFTKGDEHCPLKDDRDLLMQKIEDSDGVIFATPNYALQVTAIMKNFLDRLAFVFHRPRYFNKSFIPIVTQAIYGGERIAKYLEEVADWWGFKIARGVVVTTISPRTEAEQAAITRTVEKGAKRFYRELTGQKRKSPSLFRFFVFRMIRSMHIALPDEEWSDYRYYRDNGWLTSDYYYRIRMGIFRRVLGRFIDWAGGEMAVKRNREIQKKAATS